MPSVPRSLILQDNSYFHVTLKFHNFIWALQLDWAKKLYYNLLCKYKDQYNVQIYHYNLMDSHPHLVGKLNSLEDFSAFFRRVHSLFAKAYNKVNTRRGQVFLDRFVSQQVERKDDMITVMAYVDLNQLKANMVKHPSENKYSSYAYYAEGKEDTLVTESPFYTELGKTKEERQSNYIKLIDSFIDIWESIKEKLHNENKYFIGYEKWVEEKENNRIKIMKDKYEKWKVKLKNN